MAGGAIGRRWSYFLSVVGAASANVLQIATIRELLWFMAIYGFFTIGGFGIFAVYLPELLPTRIRASGPGFLLEHGLHIHSCGSVRVRDACRGI